MDSLKDLILPLFCLFLLPQIVVGENRTGDGTVAHHLNRTQPRGTNMISCEAYEAIKYNGYTIDQINATKGDSVQIKQMWGNYSSLDVVDIVEIYSYKYGSTGFSFRDSTFTGMTIRESSWPITVLGKSIRVGESFTELQQKFDESLKLLRPPVISTNYSISFGCPGSDYDGLLIYFDSNNDEVTEISYFVNP